MKKETQEKLTSVDQTFQLIKKTILDETEDNSIPKLIVQTLQDFNGKKLTVKHEKILKEKVDSSCYIRKYLGWTQIVWKQDKDDYYLRISTSETNVVIDVDFIINDNGRWFDALEERNIKRHQLYLNETLLKRAAKAMYDYQKAKEEIEAVLTYDNMDPIYHTLRKITGYTNQNV